MAILNWVSYDLFTISGISSPNKFHFCSKVFISKMIG